MGDTDRCVYALLLVLDEDGYLSSARGLEDLRELSYGLLQNLGRTNIDLGDDNHDRDIKRQSYTEMLLAHTNQTVVGCNHE